MSIYPRYTLLGLTEYFVQIMDLNNIGFLCVIVPRVSDAKIKAGILFIGPQMRELMKDEIFNIRAEIEPT
jgi:hypothetical protein